ncbi:MAG: leucine-rich repeat domain-containing protein [Clostridiales bacterium]|nr:leucine-rich repeat domain-containing protein [Clostridiales bacterium]
MNVTNINSCAIVKKYSVIEKDGKKYIALRIKNALSEPITGFDIKVRQYDKNGRSIGTVVLSTTTLKEEDADFVWVSKTPMLDKCDHCETEIKRICYGDYTYTRRGDGVMLSYTDRAARSRAAKAFYLKSGDGSNQVLTHNYVKHAVGVGVLSIILILIALAVSVLQIIVFRNTAEEFAYQGVIYRFVDKDKKDDTDIHIVGFNGRYSDVSIPEKIEGHRVVGISETAFSGSPYLHTLTIESSTLSVPNDAFKNCNNLKSVKLVGVTNVGSNAFFGCKSLKSLEMKGVKVIGEKAFVRTGLTYLDLSGNAGVKIGGNAFSYCVDLETVKLSDTVEFGDGNVFIGSGVKNVEFDVLSPTISFVSIFGEGNSVENISAAKLEKVPELFCDGMNKLKSFTVGELTDKNIGAGAFRNLELLETFDVGGAVTSIGSGAFYNCGIKYIDLSNITEIDQSSFYNCRALTEVKFSNELETIGDYAFYGCASLKKAELPFPAKSIGAHAFEKCSALIDVSLNDSIVSVGESAFENSGITKMVFPDTIRLIARGALKNTKSLVELKTPHFFTRDNPGTVEDMFGGAVPESLARIQITLSSSLKNQALRGLTHVKEFIIPEDLDVIDEYAFAGCTSLEKVNMPAALTEIKPYAFSSCSSLKNIDFPSLLKKVGKYAFAGCSSVLELFIPKGLEIEPCAFTGMLGLRSLTTYSLEVSTGETGIYRLFTDEGGDVPSSLEAVTLVEVGDSIPAYAFARLTSVKSIVFPLTVSEIGEYAFAYCRSLERMTLPNTLKVIHSDTFLGCSSLSALNVPVSVELIEYGAFEDSGITRLSVPQNTALVNGSLYGMRSIETLVLHDIVLDGSPVALSALFGGGTVASLKTLEVAELTEIKERAFSGFTGLETVRLGGNLTEVGNNAFDGCSSLKNVSLPSTVTAVGSRAFLDCYALTELTYPEGVSVIGDYAFAGCTSLKTPALPSGLSSIGSYAFSGCTFESIVIPDGASMSSYALGGLNYVKEVTVPSTVTSSSETLSALFGGSVPFSLEKVELTNARTVPNKAFEYCFSLKTVKLNDGITSIGGNAFNYCSALTYIEIPDSVTTIGGNAFSYCGELSSVKLSASLTGIGDNAFIGCYKLYTVYNLSKLTLTIGSTSYGHVAYYALKIAKSIHDGLIIIRKDDFGFACDDNGNWHLIEYYGRGGAIALPDTFTTSVGTVTSYSIATRLFEFASITGLSVSKAVRKIGESAFANCSSLLTVEFEDGCDVELADNAFRYNGALNAVTFGNNVKLGAGYNNVFSDCINLRAIAFPDETKEIGGSMFSNCSSLSSVILPAKLEAIGAYAFSGCNLITEITLPATLTTISDGAFSDCFKLYSVCNLSRLSVTAGGTNNGGVAQYALKVSSSVAEHNNSVKVIDGYKFVLSDSGYYLVSASGEELKLDSMSGGGTVINSYSIAHHAFMNSGVRSVIMGSAVKAVGEYAFNYASFLRVLSLGENVSTIGDRAFAGCGNIETLVVRRVSFNASGAFYNARVGTVYYKGTREEWRELSLSLSYNGLRVYADCVHSDDEWTEIDGVISIVVPPLVTEVTKEATCTATGTLTVKCSRCGEVTRTEDIPMIPHDFDSNGKCTECGAVKTEERVTSDNLNEIFDAVSYFEFDEDGNIVSNANYGYTARLAFTADRDITLSLSCALSSPFGCQFKVTVGGKTVLDLTSGSRRFETDIEEGDEVVITFYNNKSDEESCTISDMTISYITPGEVSK